MGSVKNLSIQKPATANALGEGIFTFTDDYSVFDYGKMPDTIPGKGEALCRMAAYNFEHLSSKGVKSHYLGMPAPNQMRVSLVRVLFPQKGELRAGMANYLVPLEVIFRNSLPCGSSVFKRIESGQLDIKSMGLSKTPEPGTRLDPPLLDVSTKLEPTDRYLSWREAQELSFLSDGELKQLQGMARAANAFITEKAETVGLEHADGKVEFGLTPERQLILVDVLGTLDENRMLFEGVHVSKQVLRDYYLTTPWFRALETAKKKSADKKTWPAPQPLPVELRAIVSNLYKSVCEAWVGESIWDAPSLPEAVRAYLDFKESLEAKA